MTSGTASHSRRTTSRCRSSSAGASTSCAWSAASSDARSAVGRSGARRACEASCDDGPSVGSSRSTRRYARCSDDCSPGSRSAYTASASRACRNAMSSSSPTRTWCATASRSAASNRAGGGQLRVPVRGDGGAQQRLGHPAARGRRDAGQALDRRVEQLEAGAQDVGERPRQLVRLGTGLQELLREVRVALGPVDDPAQRATPSAGRRSRAVVNSRSSSSVNGDRSSRSTRGCRLSSVATGRHGWRRCRSSVR